MNPELRQEINRQVRAKFGWETPLRLEVTNTRENDRWAVVNVYRPDGEFVSEVHVEL